MNNKRLTIIFLIVFVDLLGFSLILPLLPYYAATFGADAFVTGLLVASYAVAQLIGAPLLGRWSDRAGRRPVLLISIFGTFIGFLLLGFAGALWMLFLSRVIDGLTGGNLSVAQAYIADVTDEKNRAKGLGMIGAAFGLGFIIGPAVGGALSAFGYAVPAFAAAALSFLDVDRVPRAIAGGKSHLGRVDDGAGELDSCAVRFARAQRKSRRLEEILDGTTRAMTTPFLSVWWLR